MPDDLEHELKTEGRLSTLETKMETVQGKQRTRDIQVWGMIIGALTWTANVILEKIGF